MSLDFDARRRRFLLQSSLLASATAWEMFAGRAHVRAAPGPVRTAPSLIVGERQRPTLAQGVQIGDVSAGRAVVWARSDRAARLHVEWDLDPQFRHVRRVVGPCALAASDFTARVDLGQLPSDQTIFLRVTATGLVDRQATSAPVLARFQSAPSQDLAHRASLSSRRQLRFLWSGDTVGQGFGINPDLGGMRIYETMRCHQPDFFIHCGDTIYADSPLVAERVVDAGKRWRNLITPEKSKVAETLDEFRGNYKYNLLDDNVRRFNAEIPQIWQWDDHEVHNNWSAALDLSDDDRYTEKDVRVLAARAKHAFLEYAPLRHGRGADRARIYRQIAYGPLLDVFVVDMRSYRGPNNFNRQSAASDETAFLGRPQLRWLAEGLSASTAVWKVVAADTSLGLLISDGTDAQGRVRFDAVGNGAGSAQGRELEIAELLRTLKARGVTNVVWLTADVHYTAAHYYDPNKARFNEFDPFWEFVSGPLNAATYGPNAPDDTFGLQVIFQKHAPFQKASPLAGYQFFGEVTIDALDASLRVILRNARDEALFEKRLTPRMSSHASR
jgi:alkaline phosphatase D